MKNKILLIALTVFSATNLLTGFFVVPKAQAVQASCSNNVRFLGVIPAWYAYLNVSSVDGECVVTGPGGEVIEDFSGLEKVIPYVAVALVDGLLRIAGVAAFIYVVLSGFRFVFAQGDPGKEKQARAAIANAVIGMVIAMLAAFIVGFIGRRITPS